MTSSSATLAIVFPGQGSQSVGMMKGFAGAAVVENTFREAKDIAGVDYWQMAAEGPAEALNQTVNTQPLMLVAGVACWRAWQDGGGPMPAYFAGHSLGEYTALVAAGALRFEDALPLVRFRAQAMQDAVPVGTGAMAAILGMDAQNVIEGCAEAVRSFGPNTGETVEAVNFNDPAQTVIAGSKAAVDKACEILKANGAKRALPLPVSAPFHSSLMKPAAEKLKERLAATPFAAPQVPVINNIEDRVESDPARIRAALYEQAFGPVRWVECVQAIKARGITHVVECGPGRVLAGLCKRIDPELTGAALYDPATLADVKGLLA